MRKAKLVMLISCMAVAGGFGYVRVSSAQEKETAMKAEAPAKTIATAPVKSAQEQVPAQETTSSKRSRRGGGIFSRINLADIVATLVYSLLGLIIALFGYKVYDWITPFDLRKELEIDQNTSLGIVAGAIILGLCIIIAASIMSP